MQVSLDKLFMAILSLLLVYGLPLETLAEKQKILVEYEKFTREGWDLINSSINCLPEKAQRSLAAGAKPDAIPPAPSRGPALAFAVNSGCLNVVKLLLDHGADPNGSPWGNKEGKSYLHITTWPVKVTETTPQITELLLKKGANPNSVFCCKGKACPSSPLDNARLLNWRLKHTVNRDIGKTTIAILMKYGAKSARDGEIPANCEKVSIQRIYNKTR